MKMAQREYSFFLSSKRGKFLSVQGGKAVTMLARGCNDRSMSFPICIFSHWEKASGLYCHMHIQVYQMERAEEEFHPLLFPFDPCSLAGMLRSCFRASGSLSGSICQEELIRLHWATNSKHGTGVGWGWGEAHSCYSVCMQDLISLPSSWFLWSSCLKTCGFSSKGKTPNFSL